ncbi:MAG: hypothetical protein A2086_00630 [Spirochaetes bacterium GWD1_27_9]|nr:MAG: hypothetical protein A2Z98_05140 [Spirochaetes bacterium GWB1_27_13]OHD32515.1 MAG: hypothetical protein A2086_00630 [Spirochaetes bacterium GWD1_27_9]
MKHIDILIHALCLLSGIVVALLGFLLYFKYKAKILKNYSLFILSTTFTVAATTLKNYISYNTSLVENPLSQIISILIFEIFLSLINVTFSLCASEVIRKPFSIKSKILAFMPLVFILISVITQFFYSTGKDKIIISPLIVIYFMVILFLLFFSFIFYSIRIFISLKNIDNFDLKRFLKVVAFLFIIYIPIQTLIIIFNKQAIIIFLSRNIFYFVINIVSIVFAAKYFFIKTPTIMDKIEITDYFINKYSITDREKEIIELILTGLSIKEISGKLDRSFKTVNNHIYNIYRKTNISSKIELLNLIKENMV